MVDFFNQDVWRFINTFAPWFSAAGTFSAVILSLYLARNDRRVNLEISAGHRVIMTPGDLRQPKEVLCIKVVNLGRREAQVTEIGWRFGIHRIFNKIVSPKFGIQQFESDGRSSTMPIRLKDGEEAVYYIPLSDGKSLLDGKTWLERFAGDFIGDNPIYFVHFLKVQAYTSIGKMFEAKLEKGLLEELKKAARKAKESRNSE